MIKFLDFEPYSDNGVPYIVRLHSDYLEKTASMDSDLKNAIDSLEAKDGKIYLLVNALGAGEYWSSNKNGDYFPDKILKQYHKTFEALAQVYKHHKNKPHQGDRTYGKVVFSHYNDEMHRVELIIEVDKKAAPDIVERIERGELPALSMGCKVPFDICSVCGNKAKTPREYCHHVKRGSINRIDRETEKKAYLINTRPKFFDISFVTIPADRTASVFKKVAEAEAEIITYSASVAEDLFKKAKIKEADITKEIETKVVAVSDTPKGLLRATQNDIPVNTIKDLSRKNSIAEILSTLLGLRIMPTRRDFQRIVLNGQGGGSLSDRLDRENKIFPYVISDSSELPPEALPSRLLNRNQNPLFRGLIRDHSLSKPLISIRILRMSKLAAVNEEVVMYTPETQKLGEFYSILYNVFNSDFAKEASLKYLNYQDRIELMGSAQGNLRECLINASEDFLTPNTSQLSRDIPKYASYLTPSKYWSMDKTKRNEFFNLLTT